MPGHKRNLDQTLIVAIAAGASCRAAAKKARVSERTARRRMADPEFVAAVRAARALLLRQSVARPADAGARAARTLARLCASSNEVVALSAARAVLTLMFSGFPLADFSDEMAETRAMVEALRAEIEPTHHQAGWRGATADATPTPAETPTPTPPLDGLQDFFTPGGAQ
jgi:hypothetical protein